MKKNSELTYKEMYRQPASFQAVNDTLEDIFKTLDKVFFSPYGSFGLALPGYD